MTFAWHERAGNTRERAGNTRAFSQRCVRSVRCCDKNVFDRRSNVNNGLSWVESAHKTIPCRQTSSVIDVRR